jgi:hypothetical protein
MEFQIRLAAVESSDLDFVPAAFRNAGVSGAGRYIPKEL